MDSETMPRAAMAVKPARIAFVVIKFLSPETLAIKVSSDKVGKVVW
jgi:hypothetical protein